MKGIKEKSFELFPEMHTDSGDWDVIEEQCDRDKQRKAFVKGANYVLDEIEKVIKSDRILGHPFPSLEMRYNQIITVIEQLKE